MIKLSILLNVPDTLPSYRFQVLGWHLDAAFQRTTNITDDCYSPFFLTEKKFTNSCGYLVNQIKGPFIDCIVKFNTFTCNLCK